MTPTLELDMDETALAAKLADKVLDRPWADPDEDIAVLARQFLRAREEIGRLKAQVNILSGMWESSEKECDELRAQLSALEASAVTVDGRLRDALQPTLSCWRERRFRTASTIDIIVRKDAKEYRYEGDFLKDVARVLLPDTGGGA
jgi:hypothetical protein